METWKAVPGYEGYYEVSDFGRVRSLPRLVNHSSGRKQTVRKGMLLNAGWGGAGKPYAFVNLYKNGKGRNWKIHRLVALAFIGPVPANAPCVLHNDGDCTNNHPSNLRYGTQHENVQDSMRHGVWRAKKRRLSPEQKAEIANAPGTLREVADRFGVHPVSVSKWRNAA